MNKKLFGTLLLGSLLMGGTFVSCQDYDDDIDNLQNQINQLATKADMQSEVSQLQSALASAQSAANNGVAAAEKALKEAQAAQAAADAAKAAAATKDELAAAEAKAAQAAADVKAAQDAIAAATKKQAELEAALAEVKAFAATLVSTEDFEAAKKELNDKYAALKASMESKTGTTGLTGLSVIDPNPLTLQVVFGEFGGVRKAGKGVLTPAKWEGPNAAINEIAKGTYTTAFKNKEFLIAVNPTDVDLTDATFAVVNQYGEVAPIAFGTPKAPTRGAGVYKLPLENVALDNATVKAFKESLKKGGNTAALVAGTIASQVSTTFFTQNEVKDHETSSYNTIVKNEDITGSNELVAEDPQLVLDAYIKECKSSAHDLLVYGIKFDGLTVTYKADAVEKDLPTMKFVVAQINLNGVIHEAEYTMTFAPKPAADDIEKEVSLEKAVEHQATFRLWKNVSGVNKTVNNQYQTIKNADILKAMGLTDEKSEDYIHYNHAKVLNQITYAYGTPYRYEDDSKADGCDGTHDAIAVLGLLEGSKPAVDSKTGDWTINFVQDYKHTGYSTYDVVTKEDIVYIPVVVTVDDVTNSDLEAKTVYTVTVPVQFKNFSLEGLYKWNDTEVADPVWPNYFAWASHFEVLETIDGTIPVLSTPVAAASTAKNAKNGKLKDGEILHHYTPNVTVAGALGAAYNNTIAEGRKIGYANNDVRDAKEQEIKSDYLNSIYVVKSGDANRTQYGIVIPASGTTKATYDWYDAVAPYYPTADAYYTTSAPAGYDLLAVDPKTGVNATALMNNTVTLSGLQVKGAGRTFNLPALDVKYYTTVAATPTWTASYNKMYIDATTGLKLSDAKFAPFTAGQFLGTFDIADKYGYAIEMTGVTPTVVAIKDLTTGAAVAVADLSVTEEAYAIDDKSTPTDKYGLQFKVVTEASFVAGHQYEVEVTIPGTRLYDGSAFTGNVVVTLEAVAKL